MLFARARNQHRRRFDADRFSGACDFNQVARDVASAAAELAASTLDLISREWCSSRFKPFIMFSFTNKGRAWRPTHLSVSTGLRLFYYALLSKILNVRHLLLNSAPRRRRKHQRGNFHLGVSARSFWRARIIAAAATTPPIVTAIRGPNQRR